MPTKSIFALCLSANGEVNTQNMQLHLSSWPEIEAYLAKSKAILIPIGSTEQHGPNGLLGTDALCPGNHFAPRRTTRRASWSGRRSMSARRSITWRFTGTITLRPSTMIAAMLDWAQSLTRHGFERIYWLNGHGGNIATITAAFSEMYHGVTFDDAAGSNRPPLRCMLAQLVGASRSEELCRQLFPGGRGQSRHAVRSLGHLFRLSRGAEARGDDAAHRAERVRSTTPRIIAAAFPTVASARIRRRPASRPARRSWLRRSKA